MFVSGIGSDGSIMDIIISEEFRLYNSFTKSLLLGWICLGNFAVKYIPSVIILMLPKDLDINIDAIMTINI